MILREDRSPRTLAIVFSILLAMGSAHATPPPDGVEGPHGAIEGFPVGSCYVCHDIVPGSTGPDAVKLPNETCFGCHTDGPTYGEGDPLIEDRPHATPMGNHCSLVTGNDQFEYGDFGSSWPWIEFEQEIHCTSCHDPHRTFDTDDPDPSTLNVMYIRDHTDDWQVSVFGLVTYSPSKDIKVIETSSGQETIKTVDQDIIYTGPSDFADGIGLLDAETDICEVCHTLTAHHQVDGTAPGGQSHYDGEDCRACHGHLGGFAPTGGGQPITGPHASIPDAPPGDCAICHDNPSFPGSPGNPDGLASLFCASCHDPESVAALHAHTVSGSERFEYSLECDACHDQHGWELSNIEGSENAMYLRAHISEFIQVIDHTQGGLPVEKQIESDIVFTGPSDFDDGDGIYTEDICNACHTLTNHHQNDGSAPGGQSHYDGEDCTSCHLHEEGFGTPGGLSGPPLTGLHASIPGFPDQDCYVCHDDDSFPGSPGNPDGLASIFCAGCHDPEGTADIHSHTVTGTSRFEYGIECLACHDQHGWELANAEGGENIRYLRGHISEFIQVIDHTQGGLPVDKQIESDIVFMGPGDFDDGDGQFTEDICNACHTLTNYHQNDGTAPGGQSHYDGEDCTACHSHPTGFAPSGNQPLTGPHASIPGHPEQDCYVCHNDPNFPGSPENPDGLASLFCAGCHDPALQADTHGHFASGSDRFEYEVECTICHDQHGWETGNTEGGENIQYVRGFLEADLEVIDHTSGGEVVNKSIASDIIFMDDGDFDDGDALYTEDICNTCHTLTNHHQNDGTAPGGQSHYDGEDCTACHLHPEGFGGFGGPHPQASTDCSICHLNEEGDSDLVGLHGDACSICHGTSIPNTFLGPVGSWSGECADCHNPMIGQTGNMAEHGKGHRCVVCHGEQLDTSSSRTNHWWHTDRASCEVCHGFTPDVGTEVGSGNRDICLVCHTGSSGNLDQIHNPHTRRGLSCLECHGDERPPVDVVPGDPVGGTTQVCQLCHGSENDDLRSIHKKHADELLDCGSCHIDAHLQDDRVEMLAHDDPRRAEVDRFEWQECYLCHDNENASVTYVHRKHGRHWQWCFNCHTGDDDRPFGGSGPITEPAESCALCHNGHSYTDEYPFYIHWRHADAIKCYSCHQAQPLLTDWPPEWMGGTTVGVDEDWSETGLPSRLQLTAHPNPFNPRTTIGFNLPTRAKTTVFVYDVQGQVVEMLLHGKSLDAGKHELEFESSMASGVYFVQIIAGNESANRKIVLLK